MNQLTSTKLKSKGLSFVLMADDDQDDRMFFEEILEKVAPDLAFYCLSDSRTLMTILQHIMPDLLFLDLWMPMKNGFECIEEIRRDKQLCTLPIVAFTNSSAPAAIHNAYQSGAHLVFTKPSRFSLFQKLVQDILFLDWSQPEDIREMYRAGSGVTLG